MPRLDPASNSLGPAAYQQLLARLHSATQDAAPTASGMEPDRFVRAGGDAASAAGAVAAQGFGSVLNVLHSLVEKLRSLLKGKPADPTPAPAPAPAPAPQPAPAAATYTIAPGDSLSRIAQKTLGDGNRWREIYDLNRDVLGDNPNLVFPGQVLKLPTGSSAPAPQPAPAPTPPPAPAPASGSYTVRPGDSLSAIAQRTLGDGNRWREIYDLNRDQISNPNVISAGMVLRLPGGAKAPAPQAPASGFAGGVVNGARDLINHGYVYPPNLTDKYYHDPGKVGCCADFVCDANKEAGFDLNGVMKRLGMNPHYCPSMIDYFRGHQQYLPGKTGARVGDSVFFSWDGGPSPDHVAVVTAVDAQGRPTRIAESYDFNKRAHEVDVSSGQLSCVLGYGRIVNR